MYKSIHLIPHMGSIKNRPYGYTLIELVLIVLLVSILSAAAIPKFFDVMSLSVASFYDDVLNTVRYSQKLAIGMGCDIQISHTATTLTIQTRENCTSGAFNQAVRDPGLGASNYVKTTPNGVSITSNELPIYFDRLGRARLSSDDSVSSAQIDINGSTIQIIGETGFAYEP